MKIKLAILEKDINYLRRVVSTFEAKYADKVEIYSFSDVEKALAGLAQERIDIFLVSEACELDKSAVPQRTSMVYLVEANGVDAKNGCKAIGKYQRADLIYKQILSIYAEQSEVVLGGIGIAPADGATRIVAFASPCGGVGTSSVAAAYALRLSRSGRKTLYLNLEHLGSSDSFFSAEGQSGFGDIIYSIKKRTNLSIKLESCVKRDAQGVYFFSQSKTALDMTELNEEEIGRLLRELEITGSYDTVVADFDFSLDAKFLSLLGKASRIVMVTDGSQISNAKIVRAIQSIELSERSSDTPLTKKICLIYNKYSNKSGKAVDGVELARIGGAPRYEHASSAEVTEQLSKLAMLDGI